MALVARLTARFNSYYDERPIMTMMVTNAVLGGIADTVAQTITSFRLRANRKTDGLAKRDDVNIEIADLDRKTTYKEFLPGQQGPPPFDFERLTRFMAYGFCMAPIQFRWFKFLERIFPVTKTSAFGPALKRVCFDQFIFAPAGLLVFFTTMTVAEGGGRRAVSNKLRDMYIPTLKANFIVWPAVQIVNFRLMPVQFQLVSDPRGYCEGKLTFAAFCVYHRYCLDCLFVPDQLVRLNEKVEPYVEGLNGRDCTRRCMATIIGLQACQARCRCRHSLLWCLEFPLH